MSDSSDLPVKRGRGSGTRKGVHDISPKVRQAFIQAIARIGKGDGVQGLSKIIEKELEKNPVAMLGVMARYLPQQFKVTGKVDHEHNHKHTAVQSTVSFIEGVIGDGTDSALPESLSH